MCDLPNYDSWKLQNGLEHEKVFCECSHCSREIYAGKEAFWTSEGWIHEDCFNDFAKEILNATIRVAGEDDDYEKIL